MIPKYPEFTPLKIEHKSAVESFTLNFAPYSDFNFVSLFCWNISEKTHISILNDNLVVRFSDYLSGDDVWSVLGTTKIDDTLEELLNQKDTLNFIPRAVVEEIQNKEMFDIVEDRDNADYLYDIEKLSSLGGIENKKKRNKVNRFIKAMPSISAIDYDRLTLKDSNDIRSVFTEWLRTKTETGNDFYAESKAILRFLNYCDKFDFISTNVYLENKLVAFSFNEVLGNGYAICHFEKALIIHEDIYPYLAQHTAKVLQARGCTTLNWEQDLGIVGLRKSKLSYGPKGMLEKYSIVRVKN